MPVLYQINLLHQSQGQVGLNRFYYWAIDAAGDTQDLADVFTQNIVPPILAASSVDVQFEWVVCKALTGNLQPDANNQLSFASGQITGDNLPGFNATGFWLQPFDSVFRKGAKRFPGVPETQQDNGVITPGYKVLLDSLALVLSDVLNTFGVNYVPVLARQGDPTPTSWLVNQVTNASYKRLTTQNSRKATSGAGGGAALIATGKFDWNDPAMEFLPEVDPGRFQTTYDNWIALGNTAVSGYSDNPPPPPPNLTP